MVVNLQAHDTGGYYTVASAALGDPSLLCGSAFQYVPSDDASLAITVDGAAVSDLSAVSIPGYGSVEIGYAALFDLEALGITSGDNVRIEFLVTFSNAGSRGGMASCLVGSTYYRTVPQRASLTSPACEVVNASVTLSDQITSPADPTVAVVSDLAVSDQGTGDALGSLASDGSSAFTDTIYASGAEGTLTVYDLDGSVGWPDVCSGAIDPSTSVTNAATLTGSGDAFEELGDAISGSPASASVDLAMDDADGDCVCDGADNCPTNANSDQADSDGDQVGDVCDNCVDTANNDQTDSDGDGEGDVCEGDDQPPLGEYCSYTQGGWGAVCHGHNPGCFLADNFDLYFPDGLNLGDTYGDGDGDYGILLTSSSAVEAFLPQGGTPSALDADYLDPSDDLTILAGQLAAATLGVELAPAFPAADPGGLVYTATCGGGSVLVGLSLDQILAECGDVLSGASSAVSASACTEALDAFNSGFDACAATTPCYSE